jgi:hypothetical protein
MEEIVNEVEYPKLPVGPAFFRNSSQIPASPTDISICIYPARKRFLERQAADFCFEPGDAKC